MTTTSLMMTPALMEFYAYLDAHQIDSENNVTDRFQLENPGIKNIYVEAAQGPIAITECSSASSQCGIERLCRVGGAWQRINAAIRRALEDVTLQQLAGLDAAPGRAASVNFNFDIRRQAS